MARIYWLLGSATDREADAAIALSHELPESWSIICNKMLWTPFARRFELDMVIVGDHGIYVIDEKSWRSPVKCGAERWTMANGRTVKSPLNTVENAAAVLGTGLRDEVRGLRSSVPGGMIAHAFVLFSGRGIDLDLDQCPAPDRVLRMEQAAVLIKSFDDYRAARGANLAAYQDRIVSWLLGTESPGVVPEASSEAGDVSAEGASQETRVAAETSPRPVEAGSRRGRPWLVALLAALLVVAVAVVAVAFNLSGDAGEQLAVAQSSPPPVPVAWRDAHEHVGEYVAVEGPVMDVERSPMGAETAATFINVGKEFLRDQPPDPIRFYAVVPEQYDHAFRGQVAALPGNPASPGEAYVGYVVSVTGLIEENSRGEPFIEVRSTHAITLVD